MRVEQTECVLAVARTGSFRAAAEELGMSQQALSETVRNLERELGAALIVRGRGRATLSDTGLAVLPHFEAVVASARAVRDEIGAQSGILRGSLRIGAVAAATNTSLPQAVTTFLDRNPRVALRVIGAGSADISNDVRSGVLDLGLITLASDEDPPSGLAFEPLATSRLVACLPASHPLAERTSITTADLSEERWIAFRAGYMMHRVIERIVDTSAIDDVYVTDNTHSAKAMIAAGVGVCVLPLFSATPRPDGLVTRDLDDVDLSVTLGAVTRTSAPTLRLPEEFMSVLRGDAHSTTSDSVNTRS